MICSCRSELWMRYCEPVDAVDVDGERRELQ